jgi:hypothetical protein
METQFEMKESARRAIRDHLVCTKQTEYDLLWSITCGIGGCPQSGANTEQDSVRPLLMQVLDLYWKLWSKVTEQDECPDLWGQCQQGCVHLVAGKALCEPQRGTFEWAQPLGSGSHALCPLLLGHDCSDYVLCVHVNLLCRPEAAGAERGLPMFGHK